MIAVKGNKEVKILEMHKDAYLEKGYKILDESLKVIATPSTKEAVISKLQKENEELKTQISKLQKSNKKTE